MASTRQNSEPCLQAAAAKPVGGPKLAADSNHGVKRNIDFVSNEDNDGGFEAAAHALINRCKVKETKDEGLNNIKATATLDGNGPPAANGNFDSWRHSNPERRQQRERQAQKLGAALCLRMPLVAPALTQSPPPLAVVIVNIMLHIIMLQKSILKAGSILPKWLRAF